MGEVDPERAEVLSDAIVGWTGWYETSWPACDERLVVERFGPETARDLMPRLRSLEAEFFESDARFTVEDSAMLGRTAAERFRSAPP